MPKTQNGLSLIRASELAQYSFCQRAWWLGAVKKIQTENEASLSQGRQVHARHERAVQGAKRWRQIGTLLIGGGSLFLIVILLWVWLVGF